MILSLAFGHLRVMRVLWTLPVMSAVAVIVSPTFGGLGVAAVLAMSTPTFMPRTPSLFEAALPLHARELRMARAVAALLMLALPLSVWLVVLYAAPLAWMPFPLAASLMVTAVMAMLIAYLSNNAPTTGSFNWVLASRLGLFAAAAAATLYVLPALPALALLSTSAVLMFVALTRAIPAAQTVAERSTKRDRHAARDRVATSYPLWRPLMRSWNAPLTLILPLMGWIAMVDGAWYTLQLAFMLFLANGDIRTRLAWLIRLPLSHRTRMWMVAGPPLLCIALGVALGVSMPSWTNFVDFRLRNGAPIVAEDPGADVRYTVPLAFWQTTATGTVPVITAPWGETAAADTISRVGTTFYNPYSFTSANSPRFAEWQFARATQLVYNKRLSIAEYHAMADADILPVPVLQRLPLQIVRAGALLSLLVLMLLLIEVARSSTARRYAKLTLASGVSAAVIAAAILLIDIRHLFKSEDVWLLSAGWQWLLLRVAPLLPQSIILVTMLVAAPVVALCLLLERQHKRSELSALDFYQAP